MCMSGDAALAGEKLLIVAAGAPSRDNHVLLWVLLLLRDGHLQRHRGGHEEHALHKGGASLGGGIVGALKRVQGRTAEGDDHGRPGCSSES